ncbi:hypothetical protein BEL01nite_33360 [Bradyrhizobium elkanii]|nr:hypothetical protein BEL01nite_33360 [Bradyrhizobium elkanii]
MRLAVVIKFAQGNSDLSREIHQRYDESRDGNKEENGNASLVLDVKERTHKADDDDNADRDASHDGPEDRTIDHGGAPSKTRQVRLEPAPRLILI